MKNNLGFRKGVFIVVYRFNKKNKRREYLVLKRKKHWKGWEFPKGGVEEGEKEIEAARRECFEETGLKPLRIKNFKIKGNYKYNKKFKDRPGFIGQSYKLFSAKVDSGKVKFDRREHSGYFWLSFESALNKLRFNNQKRCLRIIEKSFG